MAITRTDRNQIWANGVLVSEEVVQVDVTDKVVRADIVAKVRLAVAANKTFADRYAGGASPTQAQAIAYMEKVARQLSAIERILGAVFPELADLLVENTDT